MHRRFGASRGKAAAVRGLSPLEVFTQVQLGMAPPISAQRQFLLAQFPDELAKRGISEPKLHALDGRACTRLLRQCLFTRYLAVPFRLLTLDIEFTASPRFTSEGPTEDIIEIGLYSPARDATFSRLVRPERATLQPGTTELTGITSDMLEKDGVPFPDAWREAMAFIETPEPDELPRSESRVLLLSHGGKLADVSMLQWALKRHNLTMPPEFLFGDTYHLIRDAHRRRPVTPDKHPPSWKLADLIAWLQLPTDPAAAAAAALSKATKTRVDGTGTPIVAAEEKSAPPLRAHRAGDDARMTWDACAQTLERYGDETLTPRQQLVSRFFDQAAREEMSHHQAPAPGLAAGSLTGSLFGDAAPHDDALHLDLDSVVSERAVDAAVADTPIRGDQGPAATQPLAASPPRAA